MIYQGPACQVGWCRGWPEVSDSGPRGVRATWGPPGPAEPLFRCGGRCRRRFGVVLQEQRPCLVGRRVQEQLFLFQREQRARVVPHDVGQGDVSCAWSKSAMKAVVWPCPCRAAGSFGFLCGRRQRRCPTLQCPWRCGDASVRSTICSCPESRRVEGCRQERRFPLALGFMAQSQCARCSKTSRWGKRGPSPSALRTTHLHVVKCKCVRNTSVMSSSRIRLAPTRVQAVRPCKW